MPPDDPFDDGTWADDPLPPPSQRSWRHPSELSAPASALAPVSGHPTGRPREPGWLSGLMTGAGIVAMTIAVGLLVMTRTNTVAERAEGTTTLPAPAAATALITTTSGPLSFVGAPRSRIGLRVGDIDPDVAVNLGIIGGAWVTDVQVGGTADHAGLRRDDVVLAVDGYPVTSATDLATRLDQAATKPRPVAVGVLRGGERLTLRLALS